MKKLSLFVNPLLSIVDRHPTKLVTIITLELGFDCQYFGTKHLWYISRTFAGTVLDIHDENLFSGVVARKRDYYLLKLYIHFCD